MIILSVGCGYFVYGNVTVLKFHIIATHVSKS